MNDERIDLLIQELRATRGNAADTTEQTPALGVKVPNLLGGESVGRRTAVNQSVANSYLDELIIATVIRCEEANGMDIIRELTQVFGVQFSPGTVYPHLHSLEEEGILTYREQVRTKEYRIADEAAAKEILEELIVQLSCLSQFLEVAQPLG